MPLGPASSRNFRRLVLPLSAGVGVALAWAALMATFPILTGSDLQARLQGAAVNVLGFPVMLAARFAVPVAALLGLPPFAAGVSLAFLNGAFWAAAFLTARETLARHPDPETGTLPPAT